MIGSLINMGLFISNCRKCSSNISWFIEPPLNYICKKCNTYNSPEYIEFDFFYAGFKKADECLNPSVKPLFKEKFDNFLNSIKDNYKES